MSPRPHATESENIEIVGAREHNLDVPYLELPKRSLVVFTGVSGSGKSSLAFDTLYAEGQRRYVESLSAYARQFLGRLERPAVERLRGLSPTIAIEQKSASNNPRSTVGTITEIYDYLRVLYARAGVQHCHQCGKEVRGRSAEEVVRDVESTVAEGTRLTLFAPLVTHRKGEFRELFTELAGRGFVRARVDGEVLRLEDTPTLVKHKKHTIEVVVDRLVRRDEDRQRLTEAVEAGLREGQGELLVEVEPEGDSPSHALRFSESRMCCGVAFPELSPQSFSFNSPLGMCPSCQGLGTRIEVDPELVVPDPGLSVAEGALAPWASGHAKYFHKLLESLCKEEGIDHDKPFSKLPKKHQRILLHGLPGAEKVQVRFKNRYGRTRTYSAKYEGVIPYLKRRHAESESDSAREAIEGYMRQVACETCGGARLNPLALAVTVGGLNMHELCSLPIAETTKRLLELELDDRQALIAERILKEINSRLQFLCDVGLDYLDLERSAATLSGGEAQRIRLASQIGSGLVGVLYVLDEPSIGLHQRDNHRLIETLERLRDLGNTVLVVEHDEDTIRVADHVVDIGPGAGEHGGEVVHSGSVKQLERAKRSMTGQYLSGKRSIPVPQKRRSRGEERLKVIGAREHNLADIDVEFPLGCFVAVTGVSGSGKSTLVNDILLRSLMQHVYGSKVPPGLHRRVEGLEHLDKVINIDQSPIGRTPRSNPATYTGVFDHVRKLFARTNEAKVRGYLPGRFSFNVKGGRCEACSGDGTIKIEMHFLPDVYVPCEVCKGARYNRDTLDITFKGLNISEVLDLPCEEALEFFANQPAIARHMQTLVDVGLGYVRLGQPATTLSGGEAQRVKLASELAKRSTGHTIYLLDEPTTGLHFEDIRKLLTVLSRLVDAGNTVLVIEHNLDVIKTADWIIDLGPEGGVGGGTVVAEGSPEEVAAVPHSYTGQFLAPLLS